MISPNTEPTETLESVSVDDAVAIPRWIIYSQAALLGIVGATFFVFGVMVGSFGSGHPNKPSSLPTSCRIQGVVQFNLAGERLPDAGSVVYLLPDPPSRISRQSPAHVRPHDFQPLENEAIEWISSQGGSVVRVNRDGRFQLYAEPGNYHLLVVSKAVGGTSPGLDRHQRATLSQFFFSVELLIGDQRDIWKELAVENERATLQPLIFE